MEDARGSRPVPDPTVLTTDQLRREIGGLRELIETMIVAVRQLHEEKFDSIDIRFMERDKRVDQAVRDAKTSADAALQAAKEAVSEQNKSNTLSIAKSESAFTKQIDNLGDKINDVKDRMNVIEGRSKGIGDSWGFLVGAVGIALAVATIIFEIVQRTK